MSRKSRRHPVPALPPLLDRLIDAEERRRQRDRSLALSAFGKLALLAIPTRGVSAPADEHELFRAIDDIAAKHLRLRERRRAVKTAMNVVGEFDERHAIATANNDFRTVSDRAYFLRRTCVRRHARELRRLRLRLARAMDLSETSSGEEKANLMI